MTKREFLTKIAAGEMNDELMEMAAAEIGKLDVANEKRKGKAIQTDVKIPKKGNMKGYTKA